MFENTFQGPGAGTPLDHTLEILLMLLTAFLLGLLLGYVLWYKWRKMFVELQGEYDRLKSQHLDLEKDYAALRYKYEDLEKTDHDHRAKIMHLDADILAFRGKLEKANADLALALSSGGGAAHQTRIHELEAQLVSLQGEFDKTVYDMNLLLNMPPGGEGTMTGNLQDENASLKAKVGSLEADVTSLTYRLADCEGDMKATQSRGAVMGAATATEAAPVPDDLKIVEGIGPKIAGLLNDAGIWTWRQLSNTSEERLQEILDAAGPAYKIADPGTWAKQAGMAADGEWDKLEEYKDFLVGGKNPE